MTKENRVAIDRAVALPETVFIKRNIIQLHTLKMVKILAPAAHRVDTTSGDGRARRCQIVSHLVAAVQSGASACAAAINKYAGLANPCPATRTDKD